jgi:hypothetical protein
VAPCTLPVTNGLATEGARPDAVTAPRAWTQPLNAVCCDRRTTTAVIVRLSHRQGDLSLLVHVAAGMTFSCLNLPVSHSMNATTLAVASLNPKGDSLRTQKQQRCCPIARQDHRHACCCQRPLLISPSCCGFRSHVSGRCFCRGSEGTR